MNNFKLLYIIIFLVGCTSMPPIEDSVSHFDFEKGLYQVSVVQKDSASIQKTWGARADSLCPNGYKEFDKYTTDIGGGGYREGGPGIIGHAINEGIKDGGQMLVGYILCNGSELTVEQAKEILWG